MCELSKSMDRKVFYILLRHVLLFGAKIEATVHHLKAICLVTFAFMPSEFNTC